MSIGKVLLGAFLVTCTAFLAACGASHGAAEITLTPGPPPPARLGAYVWVCGLPDLVIGSADGGHTWQVRHRDASSDLIEGLLWAIAFGDRDHGWAVARGSSRLQARVLTTSDGGRTWSSRYLGVKSGWLYSVAASDARHVWAAGHQSLKAYGFLGKGLMLASSDGGRTWRRQRLPAGLVPTDVAFADARHGWAIAELNDAAANPYRYSVLSTSDGGARWRVRYTAASGETLNALAAVAADHCWAVGYASQQHAGLVVRTADGGLHWSAQRPVPHQDLEGVSFPDARDGWAVGSGGAVLVTHDGGATWAPQHSGVSFSDTQHGWALVGGRSLLITSDGGGSWSVLQPEGRGDLLLGITSFASGTAGQ